MRKLKTNIDGGFPFVLDDIRWMENSTADAITAFTSAFLGTQTALVLSGFDLTTTDDGSGTIILNATPGWLSYNGEVFYFEGYSGVFNLLTLKFRIKTVFDPAGLKMFETTSPPVYDTYEIRTLELQLSPIDGLFGIADLHEVRSSIADMMKNHEIFKEVLVTNNVTAPSPSPGTYHLYGRKGFGGQKYLSGLIYSTSDVLETIVLLPEEYRPKELVSFICPSSLGASAIVYIRPEGEVIFTGYTDGSHPGYALVTLTATYY